MGAHIYLLWRRFIGKVANLAGFPIVVRETNYHSALGVDVKVRTSPLYTTVTVNGVDVYFYRLSGQINGVALTPAADFGASSPSSSLGFRRPAAAHHR